MKINIGSNNMKIEGFLSLDHREADGVDIIDDAFTLKQFAENSVDEIIASHILEHASFDRTNLILKRWLKVLKPNGKIWIAVPNYELVYTKHLDDLKNNKISWEFFNSRIFGNSRVAKEMYGEDELPNVAGAFVYELAYHKAVFDIQMLIRCMNEAGFSKVEGIDKIPYKNKHPHEICALGVK